MEYIKQRPIEEIVGMRINGIPAHCVPWECIFEDKETFTPEEVFGDLIKKYGRAGTNLGGIRHREGLTQREFAKILNVTQANLSAMENGKRTIGKKIAKRIESKFKIDYRLFL